MHNLRRSDSSRAPAFGESLPVIGRQRGHVRFCAAAKRAHLVRVAVGPANRAPDAAGSDGGSRNFIA